MKLVSWRPGGQGERGGNGLGESLQPPGSALFLIPLGLKLKLDMLWHHKFKPRSQEGSIKP